MKKGIMLLMLALVMLMLAACGSKAATAPAETETTQETTEATVPQTQATEATTQPTVPATQPTVPMEYQGVYCRTWSEEIAGTVVQRNSYYILNVDHTGYVIAQEVGKITWNESRVTDNLGLTYNIALAQENGIVNLLVYEFQGSPSVYQKIAKLPADVEAKINEFNAPKPKISAPEITKNPTAETVTEGGTAYFVARANNYNSINWYIVSADRFTKMPVNNAAWTFSGVKVSGEGTTTLQLSNIPVTMNGWGVEAVFTGEGGTATTTQCFLYVNKAPKAQLYAVPSSGIYTAAKPVQLTAAPGDTISYELIDEYGVARTGTVRSGDYVTIPIVYDILYVARLTAYVVGDQSSLIVCEYTMDGTTYGTVPTTPAPQPGFDGGGYTNNEATVTLTPTGNGNFVANVNILRLCDMDGSGTYSNGIVTMSLLDPSGSPMNASYDVGSGTLTITYSTWELLPQGTVFYGVI